MNLSFQRKTDLAVQALRALAASGGRVSGGDLASTIGTTTSFLPQVLAPLIARGWIGSERGPGGGYLLAEGSAGISLFDVIEATEGPGEDGRCVLSDGPCPGSTNCAAHAVWTAGRDLLIDGFRRVPAIP